MNYPYQKQFQLFLTQQKLAPLTIKTYDATLTHFFTFLLSDRSEFAHHPELENLSEADVRAYLSAIKSNPRITLSTYNKTLSHLNRYFRYLFTHQLISIYPTLTLHGQATNPNRRLTTKWLVKLPEILTDNRLHFYTRLTLDLTSRGYTVSEFLAPGFERLWEKFTPRSDAEKQFMKEYAGFIQPLRERQGSSRLFLKQRYSPEHPELTNAGLHKYLKRDEEILGFSLAPKFLHQSFILYELRANADLTDNELLTKLRLDPASLLYYKRQLINKNQ